MSLLLSGLQTAASIFRTSLTTKVIPASFIRFSSGGSTETEQAVEGNEGSTVKIPPGKDRSAIIPVETSIKYLNSNAYKETYGNNPVWKLYRRNYKGQYPPYKTRKTCIRNNIISTGNPCPICRDEFLVIDYTNVELLKQFISEYNGAILSYSVTGLCQRAHNNLLVAILKAKDYGLITFDLPIRQYNYLEWQEKKYIANPL